MIKKLTWLVGAAALAHSHLASAQSEKWTHFGIRPLAMGNAFVSVADDYNALFYNPAGLARLKSWDGEFLNPYMMLSSRTKDFFDDATSLTSGGGDSTKATLDLIEKEAGNSQYIALGLTPHLIFKHFGFGLGVELEANMLFHRYPSVYLNVGPRLVMPFSFAMNFLEERLSVGVSVKARVRGGINHEFSIQDLNAFKDDDTNSEDGPKLDDFVEGGYGMGADFGMLFTPVKTMEPTLGLSISDLGGTPYTKMDVGDEAQLGAPATVLPSVNVGMSLKPIQTGRMYLMTSAEMHGINLPHSFSKKLNLGMEWGLGDLIKVQSGLHQGYFTGGLQFDVGLLNLRLATYAVEQGAVAGTEMDRRYALQIKLLI